MNNRTLIYTILFVCACLATSLAQWAEQGFDLESNEVPPSAQRLLDAVIDGFPDTPLTVEGELRIKNSKGEKDRYTQCRNAA